MNRILTFIPLLARASGVFAAASGVFAAASGVFVAATGAFAADGSAAAPDEIVLGMSTVLSGPAADLGSAMRQGVLAGLERANRTGGIHGRRLRLIALDDGYEPARTAPNMRRLIEKENVLAVIGNVGTPTAIAALPIAQEQKTLFFAAFTGAGVLRQNPPQRYVINYRASYAEEIGAMIDGLIDGAGLALEDIAFFTQRDGYGDAGFAGGLAALERHGLKDGKRILHVRYERNTLAVESALASLLYAGREPRAVVMVGAYAPCARFIKLACESGLGAVFLNVSFVGTESLAAELGNLPARVIVTQVVPDPQAVALPVIDEYRADSLALDPVAKTSYGALEGYLAARIFTRALTTLPGPPTREGIVTALESLGKFDLGLGEPLALDARNHQACHRVWLTSLDRGAFVETPWERLFEWLKMEARP